MQAQRFDYVVLAIGVAAVSTAAVLIREAAAPALVIAAYRLMFASAPLLVIAGVRRARGRRLESAPGQTRRLLLEALAGVFLALHFGFWIASVQQTSIVTSVVLVTAQPLFVALASGPLLGEKPAGTTWLGIGLAVAGAAVMVGEDIGSGRDTLLGDLYAILGAVFASAYFLTGRRLRSTGEGWLSYVTLAYSMSAVVLIGLVVASGDSFGGYSLRTYGFLVLLALVPQLIGHTALNRSLGYLPAVSVTIAVLGEPVGATLLGALLLDEAPTAVELAGALLVLGGVYAGLRGAGRRAARVEAEPG
ncbi:MAG: EamA family transporter [Dehalococcoidia bacterium]|nr:EamA family transporter [Dehalococcoidia bacterium]